MFSLASESTPNNAIVKGSPSFKLTFPERNSEWLLFRGLCILSPVINILAQMYITTITASENNTPTIQSKIFSWQAHFLLSERFTPTTPLHLFHIHIP